MQGVQNTLKQCKTEYEINPKTKFSLPDKSFCKARRSHKLGSLYTKTGLHPCIKQKEDEKGRCMPLFWVDHWLRTCLISLYSYFEFCHHHSHDLPDAISFASVILSNFSGTSLLVWHVRALISFFSGSNGRFHPLGLDCYRLHGRNLNPFSLFFLSFLLLG